MGVTQAMVGIIRLVVETEFRILPVKICSINNDTTNAGSMTADPFGQRVDDNMNEKRRPMSTAINQTDRDVTNDVVGAVMVVGGGIAGMQAALDLADSGYYVYLVEKGPSIGGVMSQLDKTFPTNDCAM